MIPGLLDMITRGIVVVVFAYAAVVALTHWAVRSRRLNPFGAWPRTVRRISEPLLLPLERRIIRAGGSPQDAPFWLLGIAVVGGLIVSQVLTLYITPVVYLYLDRIDRVIKRRLEPQLEEVGEPPRKPAVAAE